MLRPAALLLAAALFTPPLTAGQVYVVSAVGGEPRRLTLDDGLACGSPAWSHDGERIAFDSWPARSHLNESSVCVIPAQGGPVARLGHGSVSAWSENDCLILCHTYRPTQDIVVMNANGSGRETLLQNAFSPRWLSRDAFVAIGGGGLLRYDLRSGSVEVLIGGTGVRPGYAYDATTRRFLAITHFPWKLSVVSFDPQQNAWVPRERLAPNRRIGQVSWAPDGRQAVVAIGEVKTDCALYLLDADSGADSDEAPTRLPGVPASWIACNPSWSPDGRSIAFVRLEPEPEE